MVIVVEGVGACGGQQRVITAIVVIMVLMVIRVVTVIRVITVMRVHLVMMANGSSSLSSPLLLRAVGQGGKMMRMIDR